MPGYTSTARQTAYEYLRLLSRQKVISSTVFQREKAKIDKREAKSLQLAEAKRAKREAEVIARREAKKAVTLANRKAKAKATKIIKQNARIPDNTLVLRHKVIGEMMEDENNMTYDTRESDVRDVWNKVKGMTVRIVISDGKSYISDLGSVKVGSGDKGYKSFRVLFQWATESDSDWRIVKGNEIVVFKPTKLEPDRLFQKFRDGITHCVFTPIMDKLSASIDDASDATKTRLRQRVKKLMKLQTQYETGVPEDKMEEVCRVAGMKMQLFDVLGNELATYNKDGRVGSIRMTNTRENHIDIGLVVDSDPTPMSQYDMNRIWKIYKKSGDFYMIDGDLKEGLPSRIRTLTGSYEIEDPVRDACKQFDKELGIINYKINALKQPELNEFIKSGRIINGWSCNINGGIATGCADMPSAYAQFKKCHLYRGFLGHVHQFRSGQFDKEFVEEHLGYYGFTVVSGITSLMRKMGLVEGLTTVMFSAELAYYMNEGLVVNITKGAWGSRFDFEFPDYMMTDRRYCIWAGRLAIEREETSHTMSATREWASHLATEHKVFYWGKDNLLTIKKPVKQSFTGHHIIGAMTAYVRIQMMEAMKLFNPKNLVRVVLDGIYYNGEKPAGLEWFSDKKAKSGDGSSLPWYSEQELPDFAPMGRIIGNSLLTGQGGSGKTYSVFTDKGFNTVLFVSPSHILGQDVRTKYGAKYTTIHKLIGVAGDDAKPCRAYHEENRVPPVILIDEITQIEASWIDKAFELYPESLIILAGDIDEHGRWFQCRSGGGGSFNNIWKPKDVEVIEFLEDRRSRDNKLKALKLGIRDIMVQCNLEDGCFQMSDWARRTLPISKFEFQPGDTCIAGTHKTNQKLLAMGVMSGYYKKGGFVSDVELPGYEKRGSYTIHSYQGKTIETGRVWIFIDDMFEYAMLYTAVSRAVNIDQIKFVRSRDLIVPPKEDVVAV